MAVVTDRNRYPRCCTKTAVIGGRRIYFHQLHVVENLVQPDIIQGVSCAVFGIRGGPLAPLPPPYLETASGSLTVCP
jgi:hypothetical protein